jgi:hypothetical protein
MQGAESSVVIAWALTRERDHQEPTEIPGAGNHIPTNGECQQKKAAKTGPRRREDFVSVRLS